MGAGRGEVLNQNVTQKKREKKSFCRVWICSVHYDYCSFLLQSVLLNVLCIWLMHINNQHILGILPSISRHRFLVFCPVSHVNDSWFSVLYLTSSILRFLPSSCQLLVFCPVSQSYRFLVFCPIAASHRLF